MSLDMKRIRDVAFKKYELDIKNLRRRTEEMKITPISRQIEQVQKSWTKFRVAETECYEKLEAEGEVEESTKHQDALLDIETDKDEAIEKAAQVKNDAIDEKNDARARAGAKKGAQAQIKLKEGKP